MTSGGLTNLARRLLHLWVRPRIFPDVAIHGDPARPVCYVLRENWLTDLLVLQDFEIGRHRLQFLYQTPKAFAKLNQPNQLDRMKSDAGFAQVAGVELTLLDCARYFHKAAGINGVAQIAKDIGAKAEPRALAKAAAAAYENSSVRRLGYLLERAGHARQANALEPFVKKAKTAVPLDPAVKSLIESLSGLHEKNARWKLVINEPVEIDF